MQSEIKTLIIAQVGETKDFRHYVAYVLDGDGYQHLVTPLNHSGNRMESGRPHDTFRCSHWDSPRFKAIRACRKEATERGHGDHFLVVFVSGDNETPMMTTNDDYKALVEPS